MKKLVFTLMMIIGFVLFGNAQSEKVKTKINKKIEKINQQITASDPSAALTQEQKKQMFVLYVELNKKLRKIKKEHKGAENLKQLLKAETKKVNKKINKEILTKRQRQAKKATRQKKNN